MYIDQPSHASYLGHTPDLNDAERRQIEVLNQSLVNKLLYSPGWRLKASFGKGHGHAAGCGEAVRDLFALDG